MNKPTKNNTAPKIATCMLCENKNIANNAPIIVNAKPTHCIINTLNRTIEIINIVTNKVNEIRR